MKRARNEASIRPPTFKNISDPICSKIVLTTRGKTETLTCNKERITDPAYLPSASVISVMEFHRVQGDNLKIGQAKMYVAH